MHVAEIADVCFDEIVAVRGRGAAAPARSGMRLTPSSAASEQFVGPRLHEPR